jgi:hypothetical protein
MLENDVTIESPPPTTKRKPRKRIDASSLFVAMLVVAAGAGLYYMHWRTAETLKLIRGADAETASVDTFLSGGRANLALLGQSIRETRATVAQLTRTPMPVPASSLFDPRDPFAFDSLEPKDAPAPVVASNGAREQTKARLLNQARTLQVQSIMFGSTKRSCLINGKLYFEGQPCGEFSVASITTDSVLLEVDDLRFELRLRK